MVNMVTEDFSLVLNFYPLTRATQVRVRGVQIIQVRQLCIFRASVQKGRIVLILFVASPDWPATPTMQITARNVMIGEGSCMRIVRSPEPAGSGPEPVSKSVC